MSMLTVLVHEADEGEAGFWAEVPELPGCVSQEETLDELEANIIEAIQACIAVGMADDDWPMAKTIRRWDLQIPDIDGKKTGQSLENERRNGATRKTLLLPLAPSAMRRSHFARKWLGLLTTFSGASSRRHLQ